VIEITSNQTILQSEFDQNSSTVLELCKDNILPSTKTLVLHVQTDESKQELETLTLHTKCIHPKEKRIQALELVMDLENTEVYSPVVSYFLGREVSHVTNKLGDSLSYRDLLDKRAILGKNLQGGE